MKISNIAQVVLMGFITAIYLSHGFPLLEILIVIFMFSTPIIIANLENK